jgi:transglutaminase-like putative cysteine protease
MGRRFGQVAGLFAFVLMIGRLGRLLNVGQDEPQWNLILTAAAFLGGVAWWLLGQMTNRRALKLWIFTVGGLLLAIRTMASGTLLYGILPTSDSLGVMSEEATIAWQVISTGVPPVSANPGLLAILAVVMWVIGALFSWGSSGGPYAAMFLPSLVMYFQFAVFDRGQAGLAWMTASGIAIGLAAVSMALERRGETGRARDVLGRPMARRSLTLAAVTATLLTIGAIAVAGNASNIINEYGNAPWRGRGSGGYGNGPGGTSYDGLIDLRQKVISQTDDPVFRANLGSGAPPANEIYWRMETLDVFDGEGWDRSNRSSEQVDPERPMANLYDSYQGTRYDFLTNVLIEGFSTTLAPTPGVPVEVLDPPSEGRGVSAREFSVLTDSAIVVNANLTEGDSYGVRAVYPDIDADLGVLATGADGSLTPMFASAAASGEFPYSTGTSDPATSPPDLESYTELPNLPSGIESRARALTFRAASDFERAFILEAWFRDSGEFTYSTRVSTGHDSLRLDDWLNDNTSPNFRTGYCEQFAAAMAVLVRTLEIPSRAVWGFTPGSVENINGEQIVTVRDRNAHAWVEVWLEPYGWVQFDPTPRGEQTDYPEQPTSLTAGFDPAEHLTAEETPGSPSQPSTPGADGGEPDFLDDAPEGFSATGTRWWLLGFLALIPLAATIPIYKNVRRRRRLNRVREGDVTAAWDEIVDRLADLGNPVTESMTPLEVARTTDPALLPLAVRYAAAIYGGRVDQARETDLFGAELWIDNHFDSTAKARAAMSLRSLVRRG